MRIAKPVWIGIAVLAFVLGTAAAIWLRAPTTPSEDLLALTLPDTEGRTRSLSDWKGKILVANFWATWCGPCREEIPLLNDIQRRYGGRGVQIVGVAIDDLSEVSEFMRSIPLAYPTLLADLQTLSTMARYGNASGGLPYTVVLDANGRVIGQKLGAYRAGELDRLLDSTLGKPQ